MYIYIYIFIHVYIYIHIYIHIYIYMLDVMPLCSFRMYGVCDNDTYLYVCNHSPMARVCCV